MTTSIKAAIELIEDCLESIEYVNAMSFLFGLPVAEPTEREELAQKLISQRQKLVSLLRGERKGLFINQEHVLSNLRQISRNFIEETEKRI
jgi:hypothetical protein